MFRVLTFCFLIYSSLGWGEVFEVPHFSEICSYLKPDTVVVLDIDDTLLIPAQMLGCDEWFQSRMRSHQQEGLSGSESLEKSLAEWEAVRHLSKMDIVEPGTEEIIRNLQNQGYIVMGLTTQGLALAERTMQQLLDNHINMTYSAPGIEDDYQLVEGHGVLFRKGILFTSGSHKGKALFGLFDKLGYCPLRVLFVNDKLSHLKNLEETAKERGVEFIGLRYGYSDSRKAAFDEEIAHFQFTHSTFVHLLSDEEAKEQLKSYAPN